MRIALVAGALLVALVSPVDAQEGVVSGVVFGNDGMSLPMANVHVLGTTMGASGSYDGRFRFELPVGRHTLRIASPECKSQEREITVYEDTAVRITVVLELEGSRGGIIFQESNGGGIIRPIPIDSLTAWRYPARSKPVVQGPLEFALRYCLADDGDSILVNVIAEGRNVSNAPVNTCGCFSIWSTYDISLDVWMKEIPPSASLVDQLPAPDVPHWRCYPDAPKLECVAAIVAPGSSVARGIAFKFSRRDFSRWTGDLKLRATYLSGVDGTDWDNTEQVFLERLLVPIRPIGQPMRTP